MPWGRSRDLVDALLQAPALTLAHATPDAEPLVVGKGIFETFSLDDAGLADSLGRAGRAALLGKKAVGVPATAGGPLIPGLRLDTKDRGRGHRSSLAASHRAGGVVRAQRSELHHGNYIGGIQEDLECATAAISSVFSLSRNVTPYIIVAP